MNNHHLFLLHIWTESKEEQRPGRWRAALEEPHSGRQWAFANAEKLVAFLDQVAAGTRTNELAPSSQKELMKR